jgi:hypothetical protein
MQLLRIGGPPWYVLLSKELLLFLNDWSQAKQPKVSMMSLLNNTVPTYGPQEDNPIICKPIPGSNGIFYFRKGKARGEKVRVFWFYDDTDKRKVVCVWGCVKTQRTLRPEDIRTAQAMRTEYERSIANKSLTIEDGTLLVRRKS